MRRALRKVLRLVAAGIAILGAMGLGLEFVNHRMHAGVAVNWWRIILGLLAIAAGIFIFLASPSLAEQLTDDVDE